MYFCKILLKYYYLLLLLVLLHVGLFFLDGHSDKNYLFINSAYYYNVSKFYSNNTVVMLLNAPAFASLSQKYICTSRNETSTLETETHLRLTVGRGFICKWEAMLMNCGTVTNPTSLSLSIPSQPELQIPIKFEEVEHERYPVVGCFAPIFLEERWQTLIVSIELYKHYGIDLQVYYVHSAMFTILKMLQKYESSKNVKIQKSPLPEFSEELIQELGYNPRSQFDGRNQPLSYTDCLMKYRESADYILVVDSDDIMLPILTQNYLSELRHWEKIYPHSSAFVIPRRRAEITTTNDFNNFSLRSTLNSLKISDKTEFGKSAHNPKYSETAWIHWPGLNNDTAVSIPVNQTLFLHLRNWFYVDDLSNSGGNYSLKEKFDISSDKLHSVQLSDVLPPNKLEEMTRLFHQKFTKNDFISLKRSGTYSKIIDDCYWIFREWYQKHDELIPCVTPNSEICNIPDKVPGFKCITAKEKRRSIRIDNNNLINIPSSGRYWDYNDNGCIM